MKTVKGKINAFILMLGFGMMIPVTSLAQQCDHGQKKAHSDLKTELNMTDAQVKQMDALSEKYTARIKALHANEELDMDARHAAMKKIKEDKTADFYAILDDEQKKKAEVMFAKKEHHGGHHAGMHHGKKGMHGDHTKHQAARKEVHAYMQKNMLPAIKAERVAFEAKLSEEDKKEIAALRAEMEKLHAQKAKGCEHNGSESCEGQCHKDKKAHHSDNPEWKAHKEAMHALIEKHDAALAASMKVLEPKQEQWSNDIEAIFKKHAGDEMKDHHHGHKMGHMKSMHKAKFLLMDPEAKSLPGMETEMDALTVKVFPNPANATTNMSFKIKTKGTVTIEMLDLEGKRIKKVVEKSYDAGEYSVEVDLSDIDTGAYLLRLTSKDGVITQRFIKQ